MWDNHLNFSVERRRLLRWIAMAGLLPIPSGESLPKPFTATFFQPWKEHVAQPTQQWVTLVNRMRQFGCRRIILQWIGINKANDQWQIPDATIKVLLDKCLDTGLSLQIGLPYDGDWWDMLQPNNDSTLMEAYLETTARYCTDYIARTAWPEHPAFSGWYIPYEIEQHSWSTTQRRELLIPWLGKISQACLTAYPERSPGVSTYLSVLSNSALLPDLWDQILADVVLHPMIQDGVGISGLSNYVALAPLRGLLVDRGVEFDLILELFEQTSSRSGSEPFEAHSATYGRLRSQLEIAESYGAKDIVAFAVDPWMVGNSPSAHKLQAAWRASY